MLSQVLLFYDIRRHLNHTDYNKTSCAQHIMQFDNNTILTKLHGKVLPHLAPSICLINQHNLLFIPILYLNVKEHKLLLVLTKLNLTAVFLRLFEN